MLLDRRVCSLPAGMGSQGGADEGTIGEEGISGPPAPPSGPRRVKIAWTQRIGVTLLALPVFLGIVGIIDEHPVTVHTRDQGVRVAVEFPRRMRNHVAVTVRVRVENVGKNAMPDVRVSISPDYLAAFEDVSFSPAEVSPGTVAVGSIPPGAYREIQLQLRASRSFFHRGRVAVEVAGVERIHVPLRSWAWP